MQNDNPKVSPIDMNLLKELVDKRNNPPLKNRDILDKLEQIELGTKRSVEDPNILLLEKIDALQTKIGELENRDLGSRPKRQREPIAAENMLMTYMMNERMEDYKRKLKSSKNKLKKMKKNLKNENPYDNRANLYPMGQDPYQQTYGMMYPGQIQYTYPMEQGISDQMSQYHQGMHYPVYYDPYAPGYNPYPNIPQSQYNINPNPIYKQREEGRTQPSYTRQEERSNSRLRRNGTMSILSNTRSFRTSVNVMEKKQKKEPPKKMISSFESLKINEESFPLLSSDDKGMNQGHTFSSETKTDSSTQTDTNHLKPGGNYRISVNPEPDKLDKTETKSITDYTKKTFKMKKYCIAVLFCKVLTSLKRKNTIVKRDKVQGFFKDNHETFQDTLKEHLKAQLIECFVNKPYYKKNMKLTFGKMSKSVLRDGVKELATVFNKLPEWLSDFKNIKYASLLSYLCLPGMPVLKNFFCEFEIKRIPVENECLSQTLNKSVSQMIIFNVIYIRTFLEQIIMKEYSDSPLLLSVSHMLYHLMIRTFIQFLSQPNPEVSQITQLPSVIMKPFVYDFFEEIKANPNSFYVKQQKKKIDMGKIIMNISIRHYVLDRSFIYFSEEMFPIRNVIFLKPMRTLLEDKKQKQALTGQMIKNFRLIYDNLIIRQTTAKSDLNVLRLKTLTKGKGNRPNLQQFRGTETGSGDLN